MHEGLFFLKKIKAELRISNFRNVAASCWKSSDTLSRSVTHKLHISAGMVHGVMAILLFCLYVGTRLISHPSTFINQEGKVLWSHRNKDSPVISFMDTFGARRHSHAVNQCSPNTQIQFNQKNLYQLYFYATCNKERFQCRKCPFIITFTSKPTFGHF